MQLSFDITPEFVTTPPPTETETETDITELPRDHLFFSEGYGEFAIGDTFIIDNPTETTPPREYRITGFEGFRDEINDKDSIQIICYPTEPDYHEAPREMYYPYTTFCDAVYKSKFVTFTAPDYLVDDINSILSPNSREPRANPNADTPRETIEEILKLKVYYGYLEIQNNGDFNNA